MFAPGGMSGIQAEASRAIWENNFIYMGSILDGDSTTKQKIVIRMKYVHLLKSACLILMSYIIFK